VAEDFFTSVYPTISAGETTKILLTSTPLGYNHFWKFWNEAEQGRNGFKPLFIPYNRIPGRTEKWAAEQRAMLGDLKFNQEVLCRFLGSSNTLINPDTISRMSTIPFTYSKDGLDIIEPPIRATKNDKGELEGESHVYTLVADTSRGVGGDYSAFAVMDITKYPYKVVAKYRNNKISPLIFANIIEKVAKDCIAVESILIACPLDRDIEDVVTFQKVFVSVPEFRPAKPLQVTLQPEAEISVDEYEFSTLPPALFIPINPPVLAAPMLL
jgi:hypothetical protein